MLCVEVQDKLWELADAGDEIRCHVRECAACSAAEGEIARIREALRRPASTERLAAGVIARLSRPRRPAWTGVMRYAAGFLIGALAMGVTALRPAPEPPAVQALPRPPLERLLANFAASDPHFEETFVVALNDTLRRRSILASAPANHSMEDRP
ncbi:MAG: hypothetical protein HYY16_10730 [Planctomycetes bacterium]|nr:hypothetical protein [Planctomycetota bacterium]